MGTAVANDRLPPGVQGLAQLRSIVFEPHDFDKDGNLNDYHCFMSAEVVEPPEHAGRTIEQSIGLRDRTLGDGVPVTFEDSLAQVLNELRKLDRDGRPPTSLSGGSLEEYAERLVAGGPVFRFRTWGTPGRVFTSWMGVVRGVTA